MVYGTYNSSYWGASHCTEIVEKCGWCNLSESFLVVYIFQGISSLKVRWKISWRIRDLGLPTLPTLDWVIDDRLSGHRPLSQTPKVLLIPSHPKAFNPDQSTGIQPSNLSSMAPWSNGPEILKIQGFKIQKMPSFRNIIHSASSPSENNTRNCCTSAPRSLPRATSCAKSSSKCWCRTARRTAEKTLKLLDTAWRHVGLRLVVPLPVMWTLVYKP